MQRVIFFKFCIEFPFKKNLIRFFLLRFFIFLSSVGYILDRGLDLPLWALAFDCPCHSSVSIHFHNNATVNSVAIFFSIPWFTYCGNSPRR